MDNNELEKKLLELELLPPEDADPVINIKNLASLVPPESKSVLYEIYEKFNKNSEETGYAILISTLYNPQSEALKVIKDFTPNFGREQKFDKRFYELLRNGHEKRNRNRINHNVYFLQAELENMKGQNKIEGKIGPGPTPSPHYNRIGGK